MPWFIPLIMSAFSTIASTATGIGQAKTQESIANKQIAEQNRLYDMQRLQADAEQMNTNQQTVNQFKKAIGSISTMSNNNPYTSLSGTLTPNRDTYLAKNGTKKHITNNDDKFVDRLAYAKIANNLMRI